jgi:hypothetical protein
MEEAGVSRIGRRKNYLQERGGEGKRTEEKKPKNDERAGASGGRVACWLARIWNSYFIPRV